MNERLPKKEILKDLDFVFKEGEFFKGNNLVIYHIDSEERKFGVTVSKNIKKKVERNRLKRLVREVYRKNKELFKGINVFLVRKEGLSYKEIEEELKKFAEIFKNA
ncbi:MAG: ribonuclease P protein component [candidate division WOR-3 bacterium]